MSAPAPDVELRTITTLADLPAAQWDALTDGNPFLSHAFLSALQESGCATQRSGWQAQFLTLWQDASLIGAMPLYLKRHSYGEYVFDWAWAEAYERHGLAYYPKLLCAVPFSPITGLRALAASAEMRTVLIHAALQLAQQLQVSSLHCLFPAESQAREMQQAGMMLRQGVQFHWQNPGYADFDAYLACMNNDKRKKIKQERRRVRDAGISFTRTTGSRITTEMWAFFVRCYDSTYIQHHSTPYLNLDFFQRIGATMPDNVLLIIAWRDGQPIASALNIYTPHTLYGRYWGALEYHPGLHFEACYYQAIEFCITEKIAVFEGGAQGEHKIARGFLPVTTWSAHWLAHTEFSRAVEDFLARETQGMARYTDELNERNPFKQLPSD
ncbi:MAG: GNAT family N-acetyltransferase [Sulfuriferula sp.]|nr:GNAT family N-acetyltransferase [Sulfuriferula sp.]